MDPLCSLLPSTDIPFWCTPNWILRGCMSASKSPSVAGAAATGAGSVAGPMGSIALGSVGSGRGCGESEGPGLIQVQDGGGRDERWREDEVTPLRSPYRPSTSDPVTALPEFSPPLCFPSFRPLFLVSSLPLLFKLAPWSSLNPYKEGGKSA